MGWYIIILLSPVVINSCSSGMPRQNKTTKLWERNETLLENVFEFCLLFILLSACLFVLSGNYTSFCYYLLNLHVCCLGYRMSRISQQETRCKIRAPDITCRLSNKLCIIKDSSYKLEKATDVVLGNFPLPLQTCKWDLPGQQGSRIYAHTISTSIPMTWSVWGCAAIAPCTVFTKGFIPILYQMTTRQCHPRTWPTCRSHITRPVDSESWEPGYTVQKSMDTHATNRSMDIPQHRGLWTPPHNTEVYGHLHTTHRPVDTSTQHRDLWTPPHNT